MYIAKILCIYMLTYFILSFSNSYKQAIKLQFHSWNHKHHSTCPAFPKGVLCHQKDFLLSWFKPNNTARRKLIKIKMSPQFVANDPDYIEQDLWSIINDISSILSLPFLHIHPYLSSSSTPILNITRLIPFLIYPTIYNVSLRYVE